MTDGAVQMFEFPCLPQQSEVRRLICVDFKHLLTDSSKIALLKFSPMARSVFFYSLICPAQ